MRRAGSGGALHAGLPLAAAGAHTKPIRNGHSRLGSHIKVEHRLDNSLLAALTLRPANPSSMLHSPWLAAQPPLPPEAHSVSHAALSLRALHGASLGGASVDWRMHGAAWMQGALCSQAGHVPVGPTHLAWAPAHHG